MSAKRTATLIRRLAGNTIFSVTFTKRTTGERRHMVCRLGARKGVTGAGRKYDPIKKGLLTVYDVQKDGWRSIPLDAIHELKIRGNVYATS